MASQELQRASQMFKAMGQRAGSGSLADMRASLEEMLSPFRPPDDVRCEPVDAGGVRAEWITPPGSASNRVLLYLHGGGYVIGSVKMYRETIARLARAAGARGLGVDYRLAPEHPFPAAVEDGTAAYRWLLSQGIEPGRIVIAGDSAGGGLTLAVLVALRDAGVKMPAAGIPISPWVDLEALGESMTTKAAVDPIVQRDLVMPMAKFYLGGRDPRTPLAAPLYADLRGLPPLLILVGSAETLLDDSTRIAKKAEAAGVKVNLEVWEEMIHVWHIFPFLPEAQQASERIGRYIRERTG